MSRGRVNPASPVDQPPIACPLCDSRKVRESFPIGDYKILKCLACGGGFANPRPNAQELASTYDEEYTQQYMASVMHEREFARKRFAQVYSLLIKHCPEIAGTQKRILDVGCGTGRFLSEFRDAGWQARGIELSSVLADYARVHLGLSVMVGDVMASDLPGESADVISLFEVIEHAIAPRAMIVKCRGLLARGGAILIETPNFSGIGARALGRKWSQLIPPVHLNFFTVRSLETLVATTGFRILLARSSRPVVIQGIASWPKPLRMAGQKAYAMTPRFGLGGTVQLLAVKSDVT